MSHPNPERDERVVKIRERAKNLKWQRTQEDLLASTDVERAYENTINDLIGDIEYLLEQRWNRDA